MFYVSYEAGIISSILKGLKSFGSWIEFEVAYFLLFSLILGKVRLRKGLIVLIMNRSKATVKYEFLVKNKDK